MGYRWNSTYHQNYIHLPGRYCIRGRIWFRNMDKPNLPFSDRILLCEHSIYYEWHETNSPTHVEKVFNVSEVSYETRVGNLDKQCGTKCLKNTWVKWDSKHSENSRRYLHQDQYLSQECESWLIMGLSNAHKPFDGPRILWVPMEIEPSLQDTNTINSTVG